ncbi:ABC transporter ATP-binding protein [Corynebacterium uropygiale]|uniref:ABC transporter ATP-binding protein n=1 Tax=Corynebacterium uropygiale TaxID=1775911 RepID=A0A9X1TXB3_9CORY|nr:ABC transporter ATP-binding protein [Corynebacterium uropygiale]
MVALEIDHLSVGYGRRLILPSLSLPTLHGGRLVGLLGPNASGKSTFLKAVAGVKRPRSGRISVREGEQELSGTVLRRALGYVPQEIPDATALSAFEATLMAARRSSTEDPEVRTAQILHQVGLADVAERHLHEISGGQRQMVAAAQMLVGTPRLMLLDEPTSALDLHRQLFLLDTVRERVREEEALAIVALHDVNLATRYCDEIIVFRRGECVASGSPASTITPELLREVYQVEADVLQHEGAPVVLPRPSAGRAPSE